METSKMKFFLICYYTYEYGTSYIVDSIHLEPQELNEADFILEVYEGDDIDQAYNEQILDKE